MKNRIISLIILMSIIMGGFMANLSPISFAENLDENDDISTLPPGFDGMYINKDELIKIHDNDEFIRVIIELNDKDIESRLYGESKAIHRFSDDEILNLQESISLEQNLVVNKIEKLGIGLSVEERFSLLINGFSADVQYKDIATILAIPEVQDVHIANTYLIPEYIPAEAEKGNPDLIGMEKAWSLGYKGEGQLVSIIDSGIDVNHKDMRITDPDRAKVKENFKYNEKVPFGYNWAENNNNIKDHPIYNSAHGMHVAGIVAGNGEYKGVAPEAQLIGQKIFPNGTNRYAQSDALIRAVEDSLAKGADIVNMSLGSRAGYVNPNDPLHKVIQKAINNGLTFAISAGNDAFPTNPLPIFSNNPDTGVIGAPGTIKDAITVGSYESTKINQYVLEYKSGNDGGKVIYVNSNNGVSPHLALEGEEYPLVYCGKGEFKDFPEDLTGKIALIENVDYSFTWPSRYADEKNAKGIIFYNAPEHEILDVGIADDEIKIPIVLVSSDDGFRLRGIISRRGKVAFNGEAVQLDSPDAGRVSSFSSWGPNPDLGFKPNLVAPGGNIWSTVNDDQYATMSGTSMSSPNVAGAASLISQFLDEEYEGLAGREKTVEIKNRLMSTARPVRLPGDLDIEYSPRQQGAGLIQVDKAITTKALVTANDGVNGIELGSISNSKNFTISVENTGEQVLNFKLDASKVITDGRVDLPEEFDNPDYGFPRDKEYNSLSPVEVEGASISFSEEDILLNPGESKTINLTLNIPSGTNRDIFTDGFIYLNSQTEGQADLVIPYIGFYGDWEMIDIVDPQAGTEDAYFNFTCLATEYVDLGSMQQLIIILGSYEGENGEMKINNDLVSFAPQGMHSVNYRRLIPVVSLMRNAQDFEINILNENKENVRTYVRERLLRKSGWTAKAPYYITSDNWIWDGLLYDSKTGYMEQAPQGQYYIQMRSRIEGSSRWQETLLPFKLDNTGPDVSITSERPKSGQKDYKLTWEAEDALTGVEFIRIQSNSDVLAVLDGDVREYSLDTLESGMATLQVRAYDYAGNYKSAFLNYGEPTTPGEKEPVRPHAPARLEVRRGDKVNFQARYTLPRDKDGNQEGYWVETSFKVLDDSGETIISKKFDGNNQQNFYIQETETIEDDGRYEVIYEGTDSKGNHYADSRYFYIDNTAPELELTNIGEGRSIVVGEDDDIFTLEGIVSDNLTGIFLWINAEPVVEEYFNYVKIDPIEFSYDVRLRPGNNIVQIQLGDSAGNRINETLTITKPGDDRPDSMDIFGEFVNEYYSGKNTNRIKTNWDFVEKALGYNIYFNDVKANGDLITNKNYIIDSREDINLERDDYEDRLINIRIEAVNEKGKLISQGQTVVTIPKMPYIEWVKLNGEDITDEFNIMDVDNKAEIQVKFSHRLKDNWWKRSNKPTGHIKVTKQGGFRSLPANFHYDEENNIYTLRPWGGLVAGERYSLEISNNLTDIYNAKYLESTESKYLNISTIIDETDFQIESIKTLDGRDFTNNPTDRVPVNTKIVITFNKLIDIETYEEDEHDGIYSGVWLTTNSDGSKTGAKTRLVNTEYKVVEIDGKSQSILTLEPKISTGYSYKNLDENTDYYVVVEGALKDAYGKSVGENKIFNFKTFDPNAAKEKSEYELGLDKPYEIIKGKEEKLDLAIRAIDIKDEGYDRVRIRLTNESASVGDLTVKMTNEDGSETILVNQGYLGQEAGFPISYNYDSLMELTMIFDKAGDYDLRFELINLDDGEVIAEILDRVRAQLPRRPISELPSNTIILGSQAYDVRYVENNPDILDRIRNWQGEIYIKLKDNLLTNQDGEIVSENLLPSELIYYDINGNQERYTN